MLITAFILFVNRLRTASFHDRKRPNFERLQIMLSATQKFTFDKDKRLTQKKRGISYPGWGIVIPQIPFAYSVLSLVPLHEKFLFISCSPRKSARQGLTTREPQPLSAGESEWPNKLPHKTKHDTINQTINREVYHESHLSFTFDALRFPACHQGAGIPFNSCS